MSQATRIIASTLPVLGILALACASPQASSGLRAVSGECFSNFSYSLAEADDLVRAARDAEGLVGATIYLPEYYSPTIDRSDAQTGLIQSSREGDPPAFAAEIGQTEGRSSAMMLFYSATPRCEFGDEEFTEVTWGERQVRWSRAEDLPQATVDGVRGVFRAGDLVVDLTLLWRAEGAPTPDEQLEALQAVVDGFAS